MSGILSPDVNGQSNKSIMSPVHTRNESFKVREKYKIGKLQRKRKLRRNKRRKHY